MHRTNPCIDVGTEMQKSEAAARARVPFIVGVHVHSRGQKSNKIYQLQLWDFPMTSSSGRDACMPILGIKLNRCSLGLLIKNVQHL